MIFAGSVIAYGIRFVLGFVLARSLGSGQFGLYRLALGVIATAAGLTLLGLPTALVRYIPLFAGRRDQEGLLGTLQLSMGLPIAASLVAGAALFFGSVPIADRLFHEPVLAPLLRMGSLMIPFLSLIEVAAAATRGFGEMRSSAIATICRPLIALGLVVALSVTVGLTAGVTLVAFGVAAAAVSILLLFFLQARFPLSRPLRTARRDPKGLLRYSLPLYLSNLIGLAGPQLRILLLGALNAAASVGIFAVATQVNSVGQLFHSSLVTAAAPTVSELYARGVREELKRFYQTMTKWTFTVNLPLFLIMVLFPTPILSIFGRDYTGGAAALTILAWGSLVNTGTGICGLVVDMSGHTRLQLVNTLVGSALTILLSALLIPPWGLVGAAAAFLAAVAAVNLLRLVQVFLLLRMLPYNLSFAKPIAAALVAMAVTVGADRLAPFKADLTRLAAGTALLLATYAGVLLLLGLSPEDRAVLDRVARRVVPGRPGPATAAGELSEWDQDSLSGSE